jgi:hypothetical protein
LQSPRGRCAGGDAAVEVGEQRAARAVVQIEGGEHDAARPRAQEGSAEVLDAVLARPQRTARRSARGQHDERGRRQRRNLVGPEQSLALGIEQRERCGPLAPRVERVPAPSSPAGRAQGSGVAASRGEPGACARG